MVEFHKIMDFSWISHSETDPKIITKQAQDWRQHGLHHAFQLGRAVLQLLGQLRTQRVGHLDLLDLPEPSVSSAASGSYGRGGCFRENMDRSLTGNLGNSCGFPIFALKFGVPPKRKTRPISSNKRICACTLPEYFHGKAQDQLWRKVKDPWTVDHPKQ